MQGLTSDCGHRTRCQCRRQPCAVRGPVFARPSRVRTVAPRDKRYHPMVLRLLRWCFRNVRESAVKYSLESQTILICSSAILRGATLL